MWDFIATYIAEKAAGRMFVSKVGNRYFLNLKRYSTRTGAELTDTIKFEITLANIQSFKTNLTQMITDAQAL